MALEALKHEKLIEVTQARMDKAPPQQKEMFQDQIAELELGLTQSRRELRAIEANSSLGDIPANAPASINMVRGQNKAVHPVSLEDAKNILQDRRRQIVADGYELKYTDSLLAHLAKQGEIGSERFQVPFMESRHLNDHKTPNVDLSGKMGMVMKGETGEGSKYWSTSFDQLEDADSDPKLISEKLGLEYNPGQSL